MIHTVPKCSSRELIGNSRVNVIHVGLRVASGERPEAEIRHILVSCKEKLGFKFHLTAISKFYMKYSETQLINIRL